MQRLIYLLLTLWSICLAGCANQPVPLGRKDLLGFIKDGVTQQEEVYLKLGEPSAQYENSRVLAYRLRKDEGGFILVSKGVNKWMGVHYNLMLLFEQNGLLKQHGIVEIHAP